MKFWRFKLRKTAKIGPFLGQKTVFCDFDWSHSDISHRDLAKSILRSKLRLETSEFGLRSAEQIIPAISLDYSPRSA